MPKKPYVDQKLLKKIKKLKPESKQIIKTWSRDCTIVPEMVGFTFGVYNGKEFITVKVREEMVGFRLGDFAPTTKFFRHGGKMEREIEKAEMEKKIKKAG
jgi:small subunit ribosomal protein S19